MKKYMAIAMFVILGIVLVISGCACRAEVKPETTGMTESGKMEAQGGTAAEEVEYACPMHPEEVMDKAGKCPKCGMNMEKRTKSKFRPTKPK